MTDTITVEIPADVKDNSETVTDYAFMRHLSPGRGVVGPGGRDQENRIKRDYLHHQFTYYAWSDVNPDGQRCRFDMWVHNETGQVVNLFHTEYWTRVACHMGEWCPSYATYYVRQDDPREPVEEAQPYCDTHTEQIIGRPLNLREHSYITEDGNLILLSERLRIGQHD